VESVFAHIENPSPEVKAVMERLAAAYAAATTEDRAEVNKLVERAKTGKRDSTVVKLTPGMAAILFVEHNRNNREWSPTKTAEYAEQITNGEWEFTHPRRISARRAGGSGMDRRRPGDGERHARSARPPP
jgi:hypothetical protein